MPPQELPAPSRASGGGRQAHPHPRTERSASRARLTRRNAAPRSWITDRGRGRSPGGSARAGVSGGGATRWAIAAASSLFDTSSFRRMCETWTLAVLVLMTSAEAISRFVWPRATSLRTSASRGVRPRVFSRSPCGSDGSGSCGARSSRERWANRSSSRSSGFAPRRAATAYACLRGTPASAREAPAATSASAHRKRQYAARGGRSRRSQAAVASDHSAGRATPRARSCSASARASQPAALGVITEASAAARRAIAISSVPERASD